MENNTSAISKIKAKTTFTILTLILVGIIAFSPLASCATPKQPSYGTADVDGQLTEGEWDLVADEFAKMYRAWDEDKVHQSTLYLKYDVATRTLYVLVFMEEGWPILMQTNAEVYVKIDGVPMAGPGLSEFAWVEPDTPIEGQAKGFEASFTLPQDTCDIEAHVNVYDPEEDEGSQTSGTLKTGVSLFVVPEYPLGAVVAVVTGFAALALVKIKKKIVPKKLFLLVFGFF